MSEEKKVCKNCCHNKSKCTFDEVVRRAKELIKIKGVASAALLQRDLKISYAMSAEMLDLLESDGLIGPTNGAQPRKVFPNML